MRLFHYVQYIPVCLDQFQSGSNSVLSGQQTLNTAPPFGGDFLCPDAGLALLVKAGGYKKCGTPVPG